MLASYCASFVSRKRSVNALLAAERLHDAHALEPLLQRREVVAMRSRTSRYALFDTRRNQRLAKQHRRHDDERCTSASCQVSTKITMTAPTNRKHVLHEQHEALLR